MFLGGNLAMYLGFASEIFSIQDKNSNLNFDVTYVPQTRDTNKKTVFGHMYSMSITKQSKNPPSAFQAITALTEVKALEALGNITNLPPVRRDMLARRPTDAYRAVFYNSALMSKTWIDPEPQESSQTFRDMIESITSGKQRVSYAIQRATQELGAQLKQ
jgi:ABC-type glycerol-3-phosphate transport system substrate-binding protein